MTRAAQKEQATTSLKTNLLNILVANFEFADFRKAYDHFHENGPCYKIPTQKNQSENSDLSRLPCHKIKRIETINHWIVCSRNQTSYITLFKLDYAYLN
jgi:hypothetical protein